MTLERLIKNVDIVSIGADFGMLIHGISYDTRVLRKGDIFVAIKGYEVDGHKYINEAIKKGAACIICEVEPDIETQYVVVEDSRKALACISAEWFGYPAKKIKIIGVTGTNGKTSVTCLVKYVLEKCSGSKVGLIGTNGNFIGDRELYTEHTTPESFETQKLLDKMILEGCKYVVMEVSSHALYLKRVYGIEYDVGVFTNLTPEHLDFHGTMDEYARAKAILFANCKNAVVNLDDTYAKIMIDSSCGKVMTYGVENNSADLTGKDIRLSPGKTEFCVITEGSINRVYLQIPGMFSVYNALAAIASVNLLGYGIENIAPLFHSFEGVKGRAEVVPTGHDYTVLIDYAHTPDALNNIISTVRGFAKERVIVLFGCGGDRDKAKRPLMGQITAELADYMVITSDNPRTEEPGKIIDEILTGIGQSNTPYIVLENRREAICWALDNIKTGDVLLLAGKGHETYQICGNEKIHFDDREVVMEHIRQKSAESRKSEE
ncbi:MAG: UDP-N-acetylmuramoyl-L-alanyl-D-glutamate--2,6-diaminopimelate ligase [Oscillospiraceae bacterium]|jgi:UDP-N-acetylmuramoyl-L-alanyl-D-glutamate--2,6-diaminopimelate ligase|nr:UDP-N-acetylmuramoyl-L-alanyl-D-glutamate--2,6-diaminopimelate ligase [Oscillospiraceae bacterium]